MISLKKRTIEIVQNYSSGYEKENISKIKTDLITKPPSQSKMNIFSGELKNALSKNIINVKSNKYSIGSVPVIKVFQAEKSIVERKEIQNSNINEKKNIIKKPEKQTII